MSTPVLSKEKISFIYTAEAIDMLGKNGFEPQGKLSGLDMVQSVFLNGNQNPAGIRALIKENGLSINNICLVVADTAGGEMVKTALEDEIEIVPARDIPRIYNHWAACTII